MSQPPVSTNPQPVETPVTTSPQPVVTPVPTPATVAQAPTPPAPATKPERNLLGELLSRGLPISTAQQYVVFANTHGMADAPVQDIMTQFDVATGNVNHPVNPIPGPPPVVVPPAPPVVEHKPAPPPYGPGRDVYIQFRIDNINGQPDKRQAFMDKYGMNVDQLNYWINYWSYR